MTFLVLGLLCSGILGSTCLISNIWPGQRTLLRAALGRLLWWGGPFMLISYLNGSPLLNAVVLGCAAWAGAWVPHSDFPDLGGHWPAMVVDLVVSLTRCAAVLAPPAAVFLLCGAYWPAMVWATWAVLPCMLCSVMLPCGWVGLRDPRQVFGVLFGLSTGFFLAVAIWTPTPQPDMLP